MIKYSNDFNLDKIAKINKKFNLLSTNKVYNIYGLKSTFKDHLEIDGIPQQQLSKIDLNGLKARFLMKSNTDNENTCNGCGSYPEDCYCSDRTYNQIDIGIRRDVRMHVKYAAALIRTLVAACENKLVVKNSKIKQLKGVNTCVV